MATKESKEEQEAKVISEQEKIEANRRQRFKKLLPEDATRRQINSLVRSQSSPQDLKKLLDEGCPPDIAVDILS